MLDSSTEIIILHSFDDILALEEVAEIRKALGFGSFLLLSLHLLQTKPTKMAKHRLERAGTVVM